VKEARSLLKTASQWTVAFVLTVVLILFLVSIAAAQVTSDDTGQRVLRRSVAVTTNIDAVLPGIEDKLHETASESSDATPSTARSARSRSTGTDTSRRRRRPAA